MRLRRRPAIARRSGGCIRFSSCTGSLVGRSGGSRSGCFASAVVAGLLAALPKVRRRRAAPADQAPNLDQKRSRSRRLAERGWTVIHLRRWIA
jgi:hypothetical protein